MNKLSHVLTVAVAASLSACVVGPDFRSPALPAIDGYAATQDPQAAELDAETPAQQIVLGNELPTDWWGLFKNPALTQLIEQAIAHNQNIAAAQATVEQVQALVEARTGTRYPQVDLNASSGRQKYGAQFLGGLASPPPFTYYSFGAAVSYTLDFAGSIKRSIEQQNALMAYQQHQLRAAQLTVASSIVERAIEIAAIQAEIHTIDELLSDDQHNLQMVQAAFDAGSVSRVDVLSAQNQLASDATQLPKLRQQLSEVRNALVVLTGRAPGEVAPANFDLAAFELPLQLPVELPSDLVHQRPDILAAEEQLHAATAAVGVATANLYPRISLSATLGQQALEAGDLFDRASSAWGLIGNLTAPIFDGGKLRAERRAALATVSTQAARYQQVVLESFAQVANALDAIGHSGEQLSAESQALKVAQQSLDLMRESFNEGNVGVLQVLDSERLYQQARLGYVRAQAQRLHATAQLFAAVGRSQ
jgi:NodT family efflux transporter outer membrane factor (OMF) lipoprotein